MSTSSESTMGTVSEVDEMEDFRLANPTGMDTQGTPGNDTLYPVLQYPRLPRQEYQDWRYKMRRSCQEIVPDLYLGPYASATRAALPEMRAIGFTHVVCVREVMERQFIRTNHPEYFTYLVVELSDTLNDNIIPHMKVVNGFLDECINKGGRALVHGNGGTSRSAALVMGYLMWRYGVTAAQAHFYVQHKRFCVCPSDTFLIQLREYEPIYKALQTVPRVLPALSSTKRSLEEADDDKPFKNERMENPEMENGVMENAEVENSGVGNSGMENGGIENAEVENSGVENPKMANDEMDTEMEDF